MHAGGQRPPTKGHPSDSGDLKKKNYTKQVFKIKSIVSLLLKTPANFNILNMMQDLKSD